MKKILPLIFLTIFLFYGCKENSTEPTHPDKPVVEIISPENNSSFGDFLLIKVNATDDKGVVQVVIYIDNITNGSRTFYVEPYEYVWFPPLEPDSARHKIYAKAYDGDNNMTSSNVVTVYHSNLPPPKNLKIKTMSETSIELSWTNLLINESGFIIERRTIDSEESFSAIGETASLLFIDSDIQKDKRYSYRVKAFRGTDTTRSSETISVQYKVAYELTKLFSEYGGSADAKTPLAIQPYNDWILYSFQNKNRFNYYNLRTFSQHLYWVSGSEELIKDIDIYGDEKIVIATSSGKVFGRDYPQFNNNRTFLLSDGPVTDVLFWDDKAIFASAAYDGEIKVVNYNLSRLVTSYYDVQYGENIILAYDKQNDILISASESGYMTQYKIEEEEIRLTQYMGNPITAICFDKYKNRLYFGQQNGVIKIWNVETNALIDSFHAHNGTVTDIEVAQDGDIFISGGKDNTVKLWNSSSIKNFRSISDGNYLEGFITLAVSGDLNTITTSAKNIVAIWKFFKGWKKF